MLTLSGQDIGGRVEPWMGWRILRHLQRQVTEHWRYSEQRHVAKRLSDGKAQSAPGCCFVTATKVVESGEESRAESESAKRVGRRRRCGQRAEDVVAAQPAEVGPDALTGAEFRQRCIDGLKQRVRRRAWM
jgi:hypothetical protein